MLIDHADAELAAMTVSETLPGSVDGSRGGTAQIGRGIQVQQVSTAVLDSVVATDNVDAAVFLQLPLDVTVRDCVLSQTQRATIPGAEDAPPSGDGLAATQPGVESVDTWQVTLEGNTFSDNGRAGVVVETIAVTVLDGNVFFGNQLGTDGDTYPVAPSEDALIAQGGAEVTGGAPVGVGEGTAYDALELFRDPLALDTLAE